jgi:hypothetical protein
MNPISVQAQTALEQTIAYLAYLASQKATEVRQNGLKMKGGRRGRGWGGSQLRISTPSALFLIKSRKFLQRLRHLRKLAVSLSQKSHHVPGDCHWACGRICSNITDVLDKDRTRRDSHWHVQQHTGCLLCKRRLRHRMPSAAPVAGAAGRLPVSLHLYVHLLVAATESQLTSCNRTP